MTIQKERLGLDALSQTELLPVLAIQAFTIPSVLDFLTRFQQLYYAPIRPDLKRIPAFPFPL